jgi:hypothetical protein
MYTRILYGNLCCNMEMSKVQSRCRWKLGRIETSLEKGSWRFNNNERDRSKYWSLTRHFFQNAPFNRFLKISNGVRNTTFHSSIQRKRGKFTRGPLSQLLSLNMQSTGQLTDIWFPSMSLCIPHRLRPNDLLVIFFHSFSVTCQ